jgi:DNA-binding MarR family transcriptional regulator
LAKKQRAKDKITQAELSVRKQVLLLWAILGEGGGEDVPRSALEERGMLPSDDKPLRDALEARGLIKVVRRSPHRTIWITPTSRGLEWAEENLAAPPAASKLAAPILQAWLTRLSVYMSSRDIKLTSVLGPRAPEPSLDYDRLRVRIRQAYLKLTEGRMNIPVRLVNLREKLEDVDRLAFDDALKRMHLEPGITLSGFDNPQEITRADREAEINFKGTPMHVLWVTK